MSSSPSPTALAGLADALRRLEQSAVQSEDDLFSVLPVLGDPDAQRAVDLWVDQAVDLTRALAAAAGQEVARLSVVAQAAGPSSEAAREVCAPTPAGDERSARS